MNKYKDTLKKVIDTPDAVEELGEWRQGYITHEDTHCFVICECGEELSVSAFQKICKCGLIYFTHFQVFRLRRSNE